jgi:hypothetical protein
MAFSQSLLYHFLNILKYKFPVNENIWGWRYGSAVDYLPSKHKALIGSNPVPQNKQTNKQTNKQKMIASKLYLPRNNIKACSECTVL